MAAPRLSFNIKMPALAVRHLVLLLGDDGVMLHGEGVRGVSGLFSPSFEDPATDKIVEVLKRHPKVPVSILLDVLEQSYKREAVPKVGIFDRAKVVNRRIELAFPVSPLRGFVQLPPDKANPRAVNLMIVGAAQSEQVAKWTALLESLKNPLGSIAPMPMESIEMAALLAPGRQRDSETFTALVTWDRVGGFRQIVVRGGELVFTRMTPGLAPDTDGIEIAQSLEREFRATLGYLGRLGFTQTQILQVVTVLPERARDAVAGIQIAGYAPHFLTPAEAGKKLGFGSLLAADEQYGDLLHAAWYARKGAPLVAMLPPSLAQRRQIELAAVWTRRAAALVAVAALGYGGWLGTEIAGAEIDRADVVAQTGLAERQSQAAEEALAQFPAPLATVTGVVGIEKALTAVRVEPWPVLERLAAALPPDMRLHRFSFTLVPPPPPGAQQVPGAPPPSPARVEARVLLYDPATTREGAVQAARDLEVRLKRDLPDFTVSLTRYPVNILPGQSFTTIGAQSDLPFGAPYAADYAIAWPGRR
jgi:hypothetical protein